MGILYAKEFNDENKAFYWFEKAALRGDAQACLNVGTMYAKGEGVAQDFSKAAFWFQKAADQGNESAQYNLSLLSQIKKED